MNDDKETSYANTRGATEKRIGNLARECGLQLTLQRTPVDTNYKPAAQSRQTTNIVNLARHEPTRVQNLEKLLATIANRFAALLPAPANAWPAARLRLELLSIGATFANCNREAFPIVECLAVVFEDPLTGKQLAGPQGLNFSSYVRDYDFNILLPQLLAQVDPLALKGFGRLHGLLYQLLFCSTWSGGVLDKPCLFALSVSSRSHYRRQIEQHSILGTRYQQIGPTSQTSNYFAQMGLSASHFMPPGAMAPLTIYHQADQLFEQSDRDLAALIAVMETLQRIYRPEIYAADTAAADHYIPSLSNRNYTPSGVIYDREERDNQLGPAQARLAWDEFLNPHAAHLRRLLAGEIEPLFTSLGARSSALP